MGERRQSKSVSICGQNGDGHNRRRTCTKCQKTNGLQQVPAVNAGHGEKGKWPKRVVIGQHDDGNRTQPGGEWGETLPILCRVDSPSRFRAGVSAITLNTSSAAAG
jgi:hypothetical protein